MKTIGYAIDEDQEESHKRMLREEGYRLSGPIVIDGVNIGFLAVRFDEDMIVDGAVLVAVIDE